MGKGYSTDQIRNVAFISHGGVGKTSIAEGILYATGQHDRFGSVVHGTTLLDFYPDEIDRKNSINLGLGHCEWGNNKINILDTPGYSDFYSDTIAAVNVADAAVLFLSATAGIEVGTEKMWALSQEKRLPAVLVINGMDKDNIEYNSIIADAKERFKKAIVPLQVPYGTGSDFKGIVDLMKQKLYVFPDNKSGKYKEKEIPADLDVSAEREELIELIAETDDDLLEKFFDGEELTDAELKSSLRSATLAGDALPLLFSVAPLNAGSTPILDAIVDYLPSPADRPVQLAEEGGELEQSSDGPLAAIVFKTMSEPHIGELSLIRVYSGSIKHGRDIYNATSGNNERIGQIYAVNGKKRSDMPSIIAGDIGALVKLKNTHTNDIITDKANQISLDHITFPKSVINLAVLPKKKGDEDKIASALHHIEDEDPTFSVYHDSELQQTIVRGLSEIHLEMLIQRMKNRYGVEVDMKSPRIPYRETLRGKAKVSYRHKKQTGGAGQFGEVYLYMDPYSENSVVPKEFNLRGEDLDDLPWGGKLHFINAIVGGSIDAKFIPAVKKGIMEAMKQGVIAGYSVINVRLILHDGKMHPVDSNENAFKTAGRMAFRNGFLDAKPAMLEPIYDVQITVPDDYMGDVMGDLNSRRGRIQGMDPMGRFQVIRAQVPLAELDKYSTVLRSITQGRGMYTREFSHYEEVPRDIAEKLKVSKEAD
ncbi:MAG: hypothetical protein B6244_07050 [Candidatus Cloacimonetes bacterium 4572_55]|nr:MAG: hypothetical protein B6244_07050 [Candidatus Cloacimonetes bacterium 4572_55]